MYLLTLVLIFSPVIPSVPHTAPPAAWAALKDAALRLEVVGPHERWIDDYRSELGYVRRHCRELREAPPLSDAQLFPNPVRVEIGGYRVNAARELNEAYQRMLESRLEVALCHQDALRQMLCQTQQLCQVWGLVETATCPTQSWVCRRRALQNLRDKLGREDYYAGELPPCLPLWQFQIVER